jgi:hypothetical protein
MEHHRAAVRMLISTGLPLCFAVTLWLDIWLDCLEQKNSLAVASMTSIEPDFDKA